VITIINHRLTKSYQFKGLFCIDGFLRKLWCFICELGPSGGLYLFEKILDITDNDIQNANEPFLAVLSLFCQCSSLLLSIADDEEFFTEQHPFTIEESKTIAIFLKNYIFKMIWTCIDWSKTDPLRSNGFLSSTHRHAHELIVLFYDRDSRREFVGGENWLVKQIKPAAIILEYDRQKPRARVIMEQLPFIIPFQLRVQAFRKFIETERESEGLNRDDSPTQHVIIKRSRLVEDGFNNLSAFTARELRQTIRVKFYNDLGLAEAGIDQDGVFKEFLEEINKRILDPQCNLFRMTEDNKLYPSHTALINPDSLDLLQLMHGFGV
jgi:ubiquitin-protein ligase E3 B